MFEKITEPDPSNRDEWLKSKLSGHECESHPSAKSERLIIK